MHLNKLLEQIKRHQSPTEAIDKLATALEKHEGSLLERGFTILKSELAANMYEAINGPHFDEEHARYAVEGMENEDGTKGPHWTVEETLFWKLDTQQKLQELVYLYLSRFLVL